jgi:hypothetical protein
MLISINPHKPVVKTGCGDNVVIGIFSFKVAILNGALQNTPPPPFSPPSNKAFHSRKFISGTFLDCFTLNVEAVCSAEVVVTFYQPTLHNIFESPSTLLWSPETLHFPHLICAMLHLYRKAESLSSALW